MILCALNLNQMSHLVFFYQLESTISPQSMQQSTEGRLEVNLKQEAIITAVILETKRKEENWLQDMKPYWPSSLPIDAKILSTCPDYILCALVELCEGPLKTSSLVKWKDSIQTEWKKRGITF